MGMLNGKGKRTHASHMVEVDFAFRIDGILAPDAIRQAKADIVSSVARTAAGRFTVTFKAGTPGLPRQLTHAVVVQHNPDESPVAATAPAGGYVKNLDIVTTASSYTVEVDTLIENAGAASVVGDPEDNTWVSVHLVGPMVDERKDAA